MSAAELLELAEAEGVSLSLVGGRLNWEAGHEPPNELLAELKRHKQEIIEILSAANAPRPEPKAWLENVASLLGCSTDYLLTQGFIDRHDLAEQYQMPPRLIAQLINAHPLWQKPNQPLENHQTAPIDYAPQHIHHSAATATNGWTSARDALHAHALGQCSKCYPPAGRYCSNGRKLRDKYLDECEARKERPSGC